MIEGIIFLRHDQTLHLKIFLKTIRAKIDDSIYVPRLFRGIL